MKRSNWLDKDRIGGHLREFGPKSVGNLNSGYAYR